MKIKPSDFRNTIQKKRVEITDYVKPEIRGDNKLFITIKTLTTTQRDKNIAVLSGYAEYDSNTGQSKFSNNEWYHEGHVNLLIDAVDTKADDFPFEKWDQKIIDEIDKLCPDLLEYLLNEIEKLNRPLLEKKNSSSEK